MSLQPEPVAGWSSKQRWLPLLQLPDDLFEPIERSYLWPLEEIIHHLGIQLYLEDYREDTHRRRTSDFILAKDHSIENN